MTAKRRHRLGGALLAVLAVCAASSGCLDVHFLRPTPVAPGVPRELAMTSLPPHRVAPPDILLIDALRLVPRPPYHIEPLDSILVQFPAKTLPAQDMETLARAGLTINAIFPVEPEGLIKRS